MSTMKENMRKAIHESWIDLLFPLLLSEEMGKTWAYLREQTNKGVKVYPESKNCLRAFKLTPLGNIKVVILGQDPYPGVAVNMINRQATVPYATGLAFGIPDITLEKPASMRNIEKEISNSIGFPNDLTFDPTLIPWAKQGILLLNTALTVEKGKPGSHSHLWRNFTTDVIKHLGSKKEPIIWMLWGNHAKSYKKFIKDQHFVFETSHPSPLSAHKGFLGCNHFVEVNEKLKELNKKEIVW